MVSVIVPAYNAERWLEAAVASVTAQTVCDWELVLVNDGSTDGTPALCDRLAAGDRRIRALHTPNGGLSTARNNGLNVAAGEWITFLDADDLLHPEFLETMLAVADRTGADIINCGLLEFEGVHCPFPRNINQDNFTVYDTVTALRMAMYQRAGIHTSAWGKLYKRCLWESERFTPGIWYEDLDVFYRIWSQSDKFVQIRAGMYGYRQHGESFLHKYVPGRLNVLKVTERMEQWVAAHHPELTGAARDRRMSAAFNMFLLSEHAIRQRLTTRSEIGDTQRHCFDIIKARRCGSLWGRYTRPKNRVGALISYLGPGFLRLLAR